MAKPSTISDAYSVLDLEQGASLEDVKVAYKQLALRTHPDKNPGNEDATAQFQRVSEAYNILVKHLNRSETPARHPFSRFDFDEYHDEYVDENEDYDEDYDYDEDDEDLAFYLYMYAQVMQGRFPHFHFHPHSRSHSHRMQPPDTTPETVEQYQIRIARAREEQVLAGERRAKAQADRRAAQERERLQERQAAEERQRTKSANKKAQAEKERKAGANAARNQQQRVQALRSATFAAARRKDTQGVKKGVWDDAVDPTGGEIKLGREKFVHICPEDPHETLLHIAAFNGDVDLVQWLDSHSADYEERNSSGFTAFHVALRNGRIPVLQYFFEAYDSKSEDYASIYSAPPSKSVISIALESAEPEVIWMILDKGLASTEDIANVWAWVTSSEGKETISKELGAQRSGKLEEIMNVLMTFGGFTPPPSRTASGQDSEKEPRSRPNGTSLDGKEFGPSQKQNQNWTNQRRPKKESFQQRNQTSPHGENLKGSSQSPFDASRRGRGGRGRGRGRGRDRGRGRGVPMTS